MLWKLGIGYLDCAMTLSTPERPDDTLSALGEHQDWVTTSSLNADGMEEASGKDR